MQPFVLRDGARLGVGDWVCAPSGAINTNGDYYPSPGSFSGFRFVDPAILSPPSEHNNPLPAASATTAQQPKPSKLTDVDHTWLMWGTGRMAW
jgi:hypothetical protein